MGGIIHRRPVFHLLVIYLLYIKSIGVATNIDNIDTSDKHIPFVPAQVEAGGVTGRDW